MGALRGIFLLCLLAGATYADEPPELVTDRPDQTESTVTVAPGSAQLEIGWTRVSDDEGGADFDALEGPGTLLRVGLAERLELRLGWAGWIDEELELGGRELSADGAGDAEVGFKLRLRDERGMSPEMALLVSTSVPVGETGFSSERFDPAVRLALAHTLSERLSLGYNLGLATGSEPGAGGERTTLASAFYTVALGVGLGERWGAFVELFGDVPTSAPGGPVHSADGGFTFLVRPNLQLDLAAGVGISDQAPDRFVGVGLSVRWPE